MHIKNSALIVFLTFILTYGIQSQTVSINDTTNYPYWVEMMQDPNQNFYETQRAFNLYWQNREVTKGSGWKPFKRWESNMSFRINPDGSRPQPGSVKYEVDKFLKNSPKSSSGNWVSLGPSNIPSKGYKGLGRLNAIAFHPTNPDIIYVGAPSGGFWLTTVGGNSWITTTDNLPTLGVSAIIVDYSNPNNIYIGTGDRDADDAPGLGVYKSTDGGYTWTESNNGMGLVTVGAMLIDPINSQILYAGTSNGIYKSTNAGESWVRIGSGYAKDLAFKPGNSNIIYACTGGSFSYSTDAGNTWLGPNSGFDSGKRAVLAVTPDNPEVVYVMTTDSQEEFKGLYRSTNSGADFTQMSNSPNIMDWSCHGNGSGGQSWYDLCLIAEPTNENIIYAGGVNIWRSNNGGQTWNINGHWTGDCGVEAVHADHHVFAINPLNNRIYVGNDGGIYWTDNQGLNWHEVTVGMVISQAYKIGQSKTNPNVVMNGYQDNGSSVYNEGEWEFVSGGDGMECAVNPANSNIRFSTLYYGTIMRINNSYNEGSIAGNGINGITEEGAWVTPFIIDEKNANTMFVGYKNIWRSKNTNAPTYSVKWKKISEINSGNLSVLEQSPIDNNLLLAATGSSLFYTEDAQNETVMPTWNNISDFLPTHSPISDIECHPFDINTIYISQDKKIYKSTDFGKTWEDISSNLPEIHINSITYYVNSIEGLYVGTDAGVYYKDQSLDEWIFFNNGLPLSASVREIEIYYSPDSPEFDKMSAGTYGRGLWQSEPYSVSPTANFKSSVNLTTINCPVNFEDLSFGIPFNWSWEFEGGTPATSTQKNPEGVTYSQPGVYKVSLTVSNSLGTDTKTITDFITISDTLLPNVDFTSNKVVTCGIDETISFIDKSENCPIAWKWEFSPNTVQFVQNTNANSQNPKVNFLNAGSYTVSLTTTNANGDKKLVKENYILVGGFTIPFVEDFENNGLNSKNWEVENPDLLVTWGVAEVLGSTPGNKAAWMNFFDYKKTGLRRDRLISPPLTLKYVDQAYLKFNYAYASRYSTFSDSLVILISDNCGETWKRVAAYGENGTNNFVTVPKQLTFFTPSGPEDWCYGDLGTACKTIDISEWAGKDNVKIAFESVNRIGNNLYVDNITVTQFINTELIEISNELEIVPNPASTETTISHNSITQDTELRIYNSTGKLVYSKEIKANTNIFEKISTKAFAKGVYIVNIIGKDTNISKKLIVN